MNRFVILFSEKEGTSAMVDFLDNFDRVSIVRGTGRKNAEPFDRNECGPMRLKDLESCLTWIFGPEPVPMDALNDVYTRTSKTALGPIDNRRITGFKMRFTPPVPDLFGGLERYMPGPVKRLGRTLKRRRYRRMMFDVLARHDVAVFMAVRQDVLRWALSRYHGDGSGGEGHLQFKLARGEISKDDIGRIPVDVSRLGRIIAKCERDHARKRSLARRLRARGIPVRPLRYEQFLDDKPGFFREFFDHLGQAVPDDEIHQAVAAGGYYRKVHSTDISEFVINHEEVMALFGDRFEAW